MADSWNDNRINSVFFYTREAHPGERLPAHTSLDQKISQAREFQNECGIVRPVVIDDLEGTGHREFGMLPNMTYIVNQAGRIMYRADWTDPASVGSAVDYLLNARSRRSDGLRLKPFYSESIGYRWTDDPAFQQGLERAGPQAVTDFADAMQRWSSGAPLKGSLTVDES